MNGRIVIVGGYGSVGRNISVALGHRFPGEVIAAGTSSGKAQELSDATEMKVHPLEINVFNPGANSILPDETKPAIMCLDLPNAEFVRKCLKRGIHYIDISASYELLRQIEVLDAETKQHNATVVLSVGLALGLTNLLTAYSRLKFEHTVRADIFVLLGLGEAHGEAALRWTIENMTNKFSVKEKGVVKRVTSFEDGKRTVFPEGIGARTTYRFNISDQDVLPRTLQIPSISTWLCIDSVLTTGDKKFHSAGFCAAVIIGPVKDIFEPTWRGNLAGTHHESSEKVDFQVF